jgi:hypothetical protein
MPTLQDVSVAGRIGARKGCSLTSTPLSTVSEQVRVRPTLILAVGELGGRVLQGVRRRLLDLFGSLDEFPIVGCCWLNPAGAAHPEPMREIAALRFRRGEVLHLETASLPENAVCATAACDSQAQQIGRVRGQALLRAHDREVRAFLREAHTRIRDPLLADRLLQSQALRQLGMIPHISFNDKAQVFLIGAVSEGDTSGMFLDVAETLTQIFPIGSLETTAIPVLDYHLPGQPAEFGQAHAYAFLRELEATYRHSDDGAQSSLLLDNCYLIEYQHRPEQVEEALIDLLFADLSEGEFGDHKRSARINLRQNYRKHFTHHDGQYQQRFYSGFASLGLGNLGIPHESIIQQGAQGLAAAALSEWLGPVPKSHEVSEFLRNHLLEQLPLFEDKIQKREDIITALLNKGVRGGGEDEADLLHGLGAWHEETMEAFRPKLRSDSPRAFLDSLGDTIRSFEVRQLWLQGGDYNSSSVGVLLLRLRRNAERWRRQALARIEREIFNLVDERGYGISFARAVILEIAQIVQNSRSVLEERAERHAWLVYQGSEQIARLHAELSRSLARGNWDGRRHLILEHVLDKYLAQHSGHLNAKGAFLNTILKHACKQGVLACSQLLDELVGRARGDGTRSGGLLARLDRVLQQLEEVASDLGSGAGKVESTAPLWPLQHPLDYYCRLYWPDPGQRSALFSSILRSMSLTFRKMVDELDRVQVQALRQTLVQQGRRTLDPVKNDYHILRFLYRECNPEERTALLRNWVDQSEPRLSLRQRGTAGWPQVECLSMIGIPMAPAGCSAGERNEIESYADSLRQWLHNEYSQNLTFYRVSDAARLECYQEIGGFPLQALAHLDRWRQAYNRCLDDGWELHHAQAPRRLAELAPLDAPQMQALEEACEVLLVGELVELIGYTEGDYIYWETQGCWRIPHPLGAHRHGAQFLSRAPRLRQQLLHQARNVASALLNAPDPARVAEFAARLERVKQRLQGSLSADQSSHHSLEVQVQMHVLRLYASRIQECSAVRAMSVDLFSAQVERLLHGEALQAS